MSHLFISYSKKDQEFVRYLRALLEAEGFAVWFDDELNPGEDWWERLEQQIHGSAAFLVVMSPDAKASKYVRRELLLAEKLNLPVFPVLLTGDLWTNLADLQYADMRTGLRARLPGNLRDALRAIYTPPPPPARTVEITITYNDILAYEADVIAFKYADGFHGADLFAAQALLAVGIPLEAISPADSENHYTLQPTQGGLVAQQVMYISTPRLRGIGYDGVRRLGANALRFLAEAAPDTRHLAMTIHGPGFGLDENEALLSQVNGFREALDAGQFPPALERITIVEFNAARVIRLGKTLDNVWRDDPRITPLVDLTSVTDSSDWRYQLQIDTTADAGKAAVNPTANAIGKKKTTAKTHAYVILHPTSDEDIFYYGIQAPVHAHGLLCERVESQAMTDELMKQIMQRIESASVVIADLSTHDPHLYWQVGYAWGAKRPVILLSRTANTIPFPNSPVIAYNSIRDVETAIAQQLNQLKHDQNF